VSLLKKRTSLRSKIRRKSLKALNSSSKEVSQTCLLKRSLDDESFDNKMSSAMRQISEDISLKKNIVHKLKYAQLSFENIKDIKNSFNIFSKFYLEKFLEHADTTEALIAYLKTLKNTEETKEKKDETKK
jgi:hypothetical protein